MRKPTAYNRKRCGFGSFVWLALAPCLAASGGAQTAPPTNPSAPTISLPPPMPSAIPSASGSGSADTGELRGLWVVRDSLISPDSVRRVVMTAEKYHLNALFVQVRGRGDAWYNSPYEPRAESLAEKSRDFDPLRLMVQEAHAHGLQVHAWLNTFLTWSGARRPASPNHLWNAHREWFALDRKSHCSPVPTEQCEGAFLQPSNPAVQQHLFNVFTDVARRYDVDGIHFDYCRYAGSDYDFSPSTLVRFRAAMATRCAPEEIARLDQRLRQDKFIYVHAFRAQWADWRREQITGLVARIAQAVKADKPWVQISAAVFADVEDALRTRGQDWTGWLQAGYLDAVALMAYDRRTERITEQTRQAVAVAGERKVYTGLGAWRLQAHDVANKITQARQAGAAGINLFSYDDIHTRREYLATLARGVFASRAAPPRMRWLPERRQSAPEQLTQPARSARGQTTPGQPVSPGADNIASDRSAKTP